MTIIVIMLFLRLQMMTMQRATLCQATTCRELPGQLQFHRTSGLKCSSQFIQTYTWKWLSPVHLMFLPRLMYLSQSLDENWISQHDDVLRWHLGAPSKQMVILCGYISLWSQICWPQLEVAYYFRLPVAFMEAGREAEVLLFELVGPCWTTKTWHWQQARRALDIAARYVRADRLSDLAKIEIWGQWASWLGQRRISWTTVDFCGYINVGQYTSIYVLQV